MEIKNSFLADAIASLADLGKKAAEPTFHDVNGRTFLVTGSDYTEVEPPELAKPGMYITRSLNALVVLVKTEVDTLFGNDALPLYVSCNSYDSVKVLLARLQMQTFTAGRPIPPTPATSRRWWRMYVGASTKR